MIPCYVSGKGMHATSTTHSFKVTVMMWLDASGLGYDTRYRYYEQQFPDLSPAALARKVCDPIEYYDRDWPAWRAAQPADADEDELVTAFFLARDTRFRAEAQAAIYCFDEAGFGSGVNVMRFIQARKPVLGFCHREAGKRPMNVGNVLQLALEYPDLITVQRYAEVEETLSMVRTWLQALAARRH